MTDYRPAAAYIRRSYVDPNSPGDIGLEAQRAAVAALAAKDGHRDPIEYNDWGISADHAKATLRTEYSRLLEDMEAGRVAAVYAFDVDRLYRDPRDLIRLQDAARHHGVRIVTTNGPVAIGEGDDPAAEFTAFLGSMLGRFELQKAKKRARAAMAARRARGDKIGHAPYGYTAVRQPDQRMAWERDPAVDLEPVRAAYREAGSVLGAARLLNARGIPSPKGKTWHTSALTRVLETNWPDLMPRRGAAGKRIRAAAVLSQLVRCHCGHIMTPNTHRRQLYCSHGHVIEGHGRSTVQEAALLPWVKAEAARLRAPRAVRVRQADERQRADIEARRQRIADNYEDGVITRDQRDAKLAQVALDLQKLDTALEVVAVPRIDWGWPPAQLNDVLRSLWRHVELDDEMQPVSAEWRVPEWRA